MTKTKSQMAEAQKPEMRLARTLAPPFQTAVRGLTRPTIFSGRAGAQSCRHILAFGMRPLCVSENSCNSCLRESVQGFPRPLKAIQCYPRLFKGFWGKYFFISHPSPLNFQPATHYGPFRPNPAYWELFRTPSPPGVPHPINFI
jgi:hypothetical protein